MENFIVNLFIPNSSNGSDAAIVAHMYAYDHQGTVSIERCKNDEEANQKIQELLHYITIADGYNAPQPAHREIWIVGFQLKEMIYDELIWFKNFKQGRSFIRVSGAFKLCTEIDTYKVTLLSLCHYFEQLCQANNNYFILRHMLDPDDYEHLIAYLLREHPCSKDVTQEDYVLNMFVEHEKKKGKFP